MKRLHIMDGQPLYTNGFLVISEKGHGVAIDPAADAALFLQALADNNATLTHILLTHGHHDHIGSVEKLRQETGAVFSMNQADALHFGLHPDEFFTDFGKIQVDELTFETIFTPGHTPGSTCIRCGDFMFTGDTLFAGDIGRTDLPGGNASQMTQSLQKLCLAVTDDVEVLPGHEEFSTMDTEKKENPYLRF